LNNFLHFLTILYKKMWWGRPVFVGKLLLTRLSAVCYPEHGIMGCDFYKVTVDVVLKH